MDNTLPWSPSTYLKFAKERERPCLDLLSHIPNLPIQHILDVGCGPGNSTELLINRFKTAQITGLDSSKEMIVAAKDRLPQTSFIQENIATWMPESSYDLIFANATFQWVPDHLEVMIKLFKSQKSGSVFAIQVPDNLREPSHLLMKQVAKQDPWKKKFTVPIEREEIHSPEVYYASFKPFAQYLDIWETTYHFPLAHSDKIFEMMESTGLRPYLERLSLEERIEWISLYKQELKRAYPPLSNGEVIYRHPRLFIVAIR